MGTDSVVDRAGDGQTEQWRNVQGLPEKEVSEER